MGGLNATLPSRGRRKLAAHSPRPSLRTRHEAIEWAKRLPFEAGGGPEAEGEIEIRQLFELEEFGERPAVE